MFSVDEVARLNGIAPTAELKAGQERNCLAAQPVPRRSN
jgi:hypothetical protein